MIYLDFYHEFEKSSVMWNIIVIFNYNLRKPQTFSFMLIFLYLFVALLSWKQERKRRRNIHNQEELHIMLFE